jgi:hypothetical protein
MRTVRGRSGGRGGRYSMVFFDGEFEVDDSRACCCYAELYWWKKRVSKEHWRDNIDSSIYILVFVSCFVKRAVGGDNLRIWIATKMTEAR